MTNNVQAQTVQPLFTEAPTPASDPFPASNPAISQTFYVIVNPSAFANGAAAELLLNVPTQPAYLLTKVSGAGHIWKGTAVAVPGSNITLEYTNGQLFGSATLGHLFLKFRPVSNNVQAIDVISQSIFSAGEAEENDAISIDINDLTLPTAEPNTTTAPSTNAALITSPAIFGSTIQLNLHSCALSASRYAFLKRWRQSTC